MKLTQNASDEHETYPKPPLMNTNLTQNASDEHEGYPNFSDEHETHPQHHWWTLSSFIIVLMSLTLEIRHYNWSNLFCCSGA